MHVSCTFEKTTNKTKSAEFRTIDRKRQKQHKNDRRKAYKQKRNESALYC